MTGRHPVPSPPLIGDGVPNRHSGTGNKPIHRVVIHSAVMPCEPGRARQLGAMNQTSTTGSWHYATDPEDTFQCSFDSYVCWHAPPNPHSLGIEMADWPGPWPSGKRTARWWFNLRRRWRWRGANHRAMLARTADLTADLCLGYAIPPKWLTVRRLRRGERGITVHANVSAAFGQSSHWDPGAWPRRRFMRMVRRRMKDAG